MQTGNEARGRQVLSLKDEINRLDAEIVQRKSKIADLDLMESRREEIGRLLESIEKQSFAAKEAHAALMKSHGAETDAAKNEIARLKKMVEDLEQWYSHQAAERSAEVLEIDNSIVEKKNLLTSLGKDEERIRESIASLSSQEAAAKERAKIALSELAEIDGNLAGRKGELDTVIKSLQSENENHASARQQKRGEIDLLEKRIQGKLSRIEELSSQEHVLHDSISKLSADKIQIMQDTTIALEQNRDAVKKLEDTRTRSFQAQKDWEAGEDNRNQQRKDLAEWEKRLSTREEDFNVIVKRLEPKFVEIFGKTHINAHIFEPSKP